jgi:hypothetical protein
MREVLLGILTKTQERLKEKGIKSQIRLAMSRVKEPPVVVPTVNSCFVPPHSRKSWHSSELVRLLESKQTISRRLKPSYQKGIGGRNGTCLYVQVYGMSFKVFCNNKSERQIQEENGFGWDTESDENGNGIYISHITNTNGIGQRSYNIMTIASWSDETVANPQWDPEFIINKIVNIIVKAKEWAEYCKENTERFFSYRPGMNRKRGKNV